jgi:hypothetical protein
VSDCGVCVGGNIGEYCDVWNERVIKARIPHKCEECGRPIPAGSLYERVGMLWDGKWSTTRTCLDCRAIAKAFCCEGRILGDLWESVYEDLFPVMTTGCLLRVEGSSARSYLSERWRKWKGLA